MIISPSGHKRKVAHRAIPLGPNRVRPSGCAECSEHAIGWVREPTLITTVTTNTAVDVATILDSLAVGRVNRSSKATLHPGGKGVNVAKAVRALEADVVATGFVGSGPFASSLRAALNGAGVEHDFVEVAGDTRLTFVLYDMTGGSETIVNNPAAYAVAAADVARLSEKVGEYAARSSYVVFSGSLPAECAPETYRDLIEKATAAGARAVLDTSGPALAAGLRGAPFMVKPTLTELEAVLERRLRSQDAILNGCAAVQQMGVEVVVVSMGAHGALATFGDERYVVPAIPTDVVSAIGAGDAMVAGIVVALARGLDPPKGLAMGCAAAASSLRRYGAGVPVADEVAAMQPRVRVECV